MNIHVTLIAYALPVSPLIAALAGPDVVFHLYRHSNKAEVIQDIDSVIDDANICYHPYGQNRGLARSWNDGLIESQQQGADVMVVVNDDVKMEYADLAVLSRAAVNNREVGVIVCEGFDGNMMRQQMLGHVVFAVNPVAIEKVGYYDCNFYPLYFEDSDYSRRCGLAGVTYYNAGPTSIHHLGSSSIKRDLDLRRQNDVTFQKNRLFYESKWGGEPGSEVWRLPFNSENFDWKISEEMRNAPYPGYNRTDFDEVVKI